MKKKDILEQLSMTEIALERKDIRIENKDKEIENLIEEIDNLIEQLGRANNIVGNQIHTIIEANDEIAGYISGKSIADDRINLLVRTRGNLEDRLDVKDNEIAELKDKIVSLCKMYDGIIDVGEAEIKRRTIIMHYLETKDLD